MFITTAEFERLDYARIITSVVELATDITGGLETGFPTELVSNCQSRKFQCFTVLLMFFFLKSKEAHATMEGNLQLIDNLAHSGNYVPHDLELASVLLEKNATVNGWSPLEPNLDLRCEINFKFIPNTENVNFAFFSEHGLIFSKML